ncbi:hypothetical protein VPH35_001078 [Triticum aestivum]
MSKSRNISRLLAEQDEQRLEGQRRRRHGSSEGNVEEHAAAETEIEEAEEEDVDEEQQHLTPWNVALLRCAAEYLEMTEEHSEDNLAARAEAYLSQSVLLHQGAQVLRGAAAAPEELGIVARCMDAIAARSSATSRSWFDDLAVLGPHMYKRVMALEGCLVSYAKATLPGLSRSMRWRRASTPVSSEVEQRDLLEAVVASLPTDKGSGSMVTAKFLVALLRTVHILRASDAARAAIERKAATQLEQATVEDVLIPSYSGATETLYDVDYVERVLRHFLEEAAARTMASRPLTVAMVQVGKLVDNYLAEVASDANLKPTKFCELALAMPDHARIYDDGVYRAVDIYLKAYPRLTAEERDRVCGVVDFRKLTVEACTHAAQNERLPLRAVLQVLFFEQLQLRCAIMGTLIASMASPRARHPNPRLQRPVAAVRHAAGPSEAWQTTTMQESQTLRVDMDDMMSRVQGLERECSSMRRAIKKIDGSGAASQGSGSPDVAAPAGWRSRYRCKFSTQVCDSQARNAVVSRASRMGMSLGWVSRASKPSIDKRK